MPDECTCFPPSGYVGGGICPVHKSRSGEVQPDAAREELGFIVSYLAHNDQDVNHAWMVRRIRAVLAGKDPGAVEPWSQYDGVRQRRAEAPLDDMERAAMMRVVSLATARAEKADIELAAYKDLAAEYREGRDALRLEKLGSSEAKPVAAHDPITTTVVQWVEKHCALVAFDFVSDLIRSLERREEWLREALEQRREAAQPVCSCAKDDQDEWCPHHGRLDHLKVEMETLREQLAASDALCAARDEDVTRAEDAIRRALQVAVDEDIIGSNAFGILQGVVHDGIPDRRGSADVQACSVPQGQTHPTCNDCFGAGLGRAERLVRDAAGALLQTAKYRTTLATDALFGVADKISDEWRSELRRERDQANASVSNASETTGRPEVGGDEAGAGVRPMAAHQEGGVVDALGRDPNDGGVLGCVARQPAVMAGDKAGAAHVVGRAWDCTQCKRRIWDDEKDGHVRPFACPYGCGSTSRLVPAGVL